MRESFVFFRSFYEAIEEIDEKKQLKLYKAIANFALNDEKPTNLKGIEKAIFSLIEPQLTASTKRYDTSKECAKYGKLGGRPKKEKTLKGFKNETLNVNDNVNDNVNVNINVNEKGLEKKEDPTISKTKKLFIETYQNIFNARPFLSFQDNTKLLELSAEHEDFEDLIPIALSRLKDVEFKDIDFKPSASWLLKGNNFERIMNGEFEKKETTDDAISRWVTKGDG